MPDVLLFNMNVLYMSEGAIVAQKTYAFTPHSLNI